MNGSMDFGHDYMTSMGATRLRANFLLDGKLVDFPETIQEGWYLTSKETVLIVHIGKSDTKTKVTNKGEDLFHVYVWNRPSVGKAPENPGDIFNKIVNAPVRVDRRNHAQPE